MKHIAPVLALILALTVCSVPFARAEDFQHQWQGVAFSTDIPFSSPQDIGMDAVALTNPPESAPGQALFEITLVAVPKDMLESFGNNPAEVLGYVKSSFLATAKPAERTVERTFLGAPVAGEAQGLNIPKPADLEVYYVPLSRGGGMVVAFSTDPSLDQSQAETTKEMVASGFRETQ
jgi:hypothetical protein